VVPWESPGDIVRWWRTDVLGLSQQQVAERLSVGSTALSNWEHSTRDISIGFDQIDHALSGSGALADLLTLVGTPRGLDPCRVWSKVFPGPSRPIWCWIRSPEPRLRVEAEWGVFRLDTENEIEIGANGLFVTAGGSVEESPVVFQLSAPGWVDFGRGELPSTPPGAAVIDALANSQPSSATGVFMDLFSADLTQRLKRYETDPPASHGLDPEVLRAVVSGFTGPREEPAGGLWPPLPDGIETVNRQGFARLRQARSMSLAQAADRLACETDVSASKDTLRRFENDQGEPHDRMPPAALDHVLRAEGHLALSEIRSGVGTGAARFPSWWRAPVWVSIDGSDDETELQWGVWRRRVEGDAPHLLVCHHCDPSVPLRIVGGPDVRWTIGVGRPRGATPINHGWIPMSIDAAQRALHEAQYAVLDALRRT